MLAKDIKEVLITEETIQEKIHELGAVLTEEYKDKFPLAIGVLKGAMPFMSDLLKRMDTYIELDFMDVSSYGNATVSSGEVKIVKDLNTSRPRPRCSRRASASASCSSRSTPRATSPRSSSTRPSGSSPRRSIPACSRWRWTPRRRCRSTCGSTCACRCSAGSARSPRVLDFVATAAPGVKEILTIGKIVWEVRESIEGRADFDLVIVDAAATGHIVAQLGAADAIRELVDVGPLRNQTQWVSELLADPAITAVNVVTTPEEMPVAETIELVERLRTEVNVPLGDGHRQPGAARAVHARRRGDVRGAARAERRATLLTAARRPRRDRGARRGAARGVAAAHARGASRASAADGRPPAAVRAVPVRARRTVCASRAWSPTRSARSSGL